MTNQTPDSTTELDKYLPAILDNFNEAVATMSLTVAGEKEWTERYESIKSETIQAVKDGRSAALNQLIAAHTAASNKALLTRLEAQAKHMDDFVNNVEAVPLAAIEAERQQLGKESE